MFTSISQKKFIKLAGQMGTEVVRRHAGGSSWLLPDGGVVFEVKSGTNWNYFYVEAR